MPWKVVVSNQVNKFINSCTKIQRNKIIRNLFYLKEFGFTNSNPSIKKLRGIPLWEVRILGKDSIRLLCFQNRKLIIFVVHAFYKKKQKTPTKEIKQALSSLNNIDK